MTKYVVLDDVLVKTSSGVTELRKGQIVRMPEKSAWQLIEKGKVKPLPYFDRNGTLIIPFDSPPKYHWWNRGASVLSILEELKADVNILKRYSQN